MFLAQSLLSKMIKDSLPDSEQALYLSEADSVLQRLQNCGLHDCKAAAIIAYDCLLNPQPRTLKAELYDNVNYLCRIYMDRIARFYLRYDFVPDISHLKTAIIALYEKSPIFHACFVANPFRAYWRVNDYAIDDVFTVMQCEDLHEAAVAFLENCVAIDDPSQMKIALIHNGSDSILAFRWNHMIMDGGGFKHFALDLCKAYSEISCDDDISLDFRTGSRAYTAVYKDMCESLRRTAKSAIAGVSVREKKALPFSAINGDERTTIVAHFIDSDVVLSASAVAKQYGATVNDLLAAAYIFASYKMIGCETQHLNLSCAVDLRRYMKDPTQIGYTNHTTFMYCSVDKLYDSPLDLLEAVKDSNRKNKADPVLGLHGLPLLHFAYSSMIHLQAESVVRLFYRNANIALSNVGPVDVQGYALDGHNVTDALVAGGAKRKPCAAATVLTVNGHLRISVCTQGNKKDCEMLRQFFEYFEQYLVSIIPK